MFRDEFSNNSTNLSLHLSRLFFGNETPVNQNLESIRNNIPLQTTLSQIHVQSRSHLLRPIQRLRGNPRPSLRNLQSQLLQLLDQAGSIFDGVDAGPASSRVSSSPANRNEVFSVPETGNV